MWSSLARVMASAMMVAGLATYAVQPARSEDQPQYVFGAVLPLTGGLSESYGIPPKNAIDMAVEEINAAGYGFTVKVEYCDHGGEAQKGAQCANQLVNAFHVPFINTNFTPITLAMASLADRTHTLVMNSVASSPTLAHAGKYIWSSNALGQAGALVDATFIVNNLGFKKVDIVYWNTNEIGLQYSKIFPEFVKAAGGEVVNSGGFNPDAADFGSYVAKLKDSDADAMYFVAAGAGPGSLIRQLRSQGYDKPIIAFQGFPGPESQDALGDARQNLYSSFAADLSGPAASEQAKQFAAKYQARFGKAPHPSAAEHYDAIRNVFAIMLQKLHKDNEDYTGENLLNALTSIRTFPEGPSGVTSFLLDDHYSLKPVTFKKMKEDGSWEYVSSVDVPSQEKLLSGMK